MFWALLVSWALMIGAHWISPAEGLPVTLVFFLAPLLSGILMCYRNRTHEIELENTLYGILAWGFFDFVAATLLIKNADKVLPEMPVSPDVLMDHTPAQEQTFTLLFFAILLGVLPPLMTIIWRIICKIWNAGRKKQAETEKSGKSDT